MIVASSTRMQLVYKGCEQATSGKTEHTVLHSDSNIK
jgi:hypothetical protein